MAIFKMVIGGIGAAGDIWTSGTKAESSLSLAGVHAQWVDCVTAIWTDIKPYFATQTNLDDVTTYQLNTITGKATGVLRESGWGIPGTSAGAQPDPRMATVVGLRSAVPGPAGRGRMFLPGVALSNLTSTGLITFAAREFLATAISSRFVFLRSAGVRPGIHHLADPTVSQFTTVTVGQVPGTQRRRSNKIPNSYSSSPMP